MKIVQNLKNGDFITIHLFGKEKKVEVFSTGDNRFDEKGDDKEDGFALNDQELTCLHWFVTNVDLADYKKEIIKYCNDQYHMVGEAAVTEADLEDEIDIFAVAINISKMTQSKDGFVYPEISFYGNCKCDPEHGICIGFRDEKFLGIASQDWTL